MDPLVPLEKVALWLLSGVPVALGMEGWSRLLHGRLWHGLLWRVHRSHHRPRRGAFEWNDVLSFTHAPVAIALILWGCVGTPGVAREVGFGVGLGMTAFGLAYILVHDGLVHGRLPVSFLLRHAWLREIVEAHRAHHFGRPGPPYGLFLGPAELRASQQARAVAAPIPEGISPHARAPTRSAHPSAPQPPARGS